MSVKEGWSNMRPGDRVYHYMVEGTSLCGKVGFHSMHPDTISPDTGGNKGPKDCSPCWKRLEKRRGKSAPAEQGEGR